MVIPYIFYLLTWRLEDSRLQDGRSKRTGRDGSGRPTNTGRPRHRKRTRLWICCGGSSSNFCCYYCRSSDACHCMHSCHSCAYSSGNSTWKGCPQPTRPLCRRGSQAHSGIPSASTIPGRGASQGRGTSPGRGASQG